MATSWNNQKRNKGISKWDNFWIGFLPALIGTGLINIIVFKIRWDTDQPLFRAMYKFSKTGLMTKDLLIAALPCLLYIFILSKMKRERSTAGAFVGLIPYIIIFFWIAE